MFPGGSDSAPELRRLQLIANTTHHTRNRIEGSDEAATALPKEHASSTSGGGDGKDTVAAAEKGDRTALWRSCISHPSLCPDDTTPMMKETRNHDHDHAADYGAGGGGGKRTDHTWRIFFDAPPLQHYFSPRSFLETAEETKPQLSSKPFIDAKKQQAGFYGAKYLTDLTRLVNLSPAMLETAISEHIARAGHTTAEPLQVSFLPHSSIQNTAEDDDGSRRLAPRLTGWLCANPMLFGVRIPIELKVPEQFYHDAFPHHAHIPHWFLTYLAYQLDRMRSTSITQAEAVMTRSMLLFEKEEEDDASKEEEQSMPSSARAPEDDESSIVAMQHHTERLLLKCQQSMADVVQHAHHRLFPEHGDNISNHATPRMNPNNDILSASTTQLRLAAGVLFAEVQQLEQALEAEAQRVKFDIYMTFFKTLVMEKMKIMSAERSARVEADFLMEHRKGLREIREQFVRHPFTRSATGAVIYSYTIFVKTLTGKTLTLEPVFTDTTVDDIKEMIQELEGIPPCMQRLIYGGTLLDPHNHDYVLDDPDRPPSQQLVENNVSKEATLSLVLRLRHGESCCAHSPLLGACCTRDQWTASTHSFQEPLCENMFDKLFFPSWHELKKKKEKPNSIDSPHWTCTFFNCNPALRSLVRIASWSDIDPAYFASPQPASGETDELNRYERKGVVPTKVPSISEVLKLYEEAHWSLRSVSPSPTIRWTPENDPLWPLPFRKIVRYVLRIRPAVGHGHPHDFVPQEVAQLIAEFL